MSNRVKNVSYMYRNALGKFVITKSNSKRIEDTVRRCEDIMIYMDVDAIQPVIHAKWERRETLMGSFLVCGNCGSFFFATLKTAYCPYYGV